MKQRDLLKKVVEVLREMDVSYMVVGSYGSGTWGEMRFTQDIDMVVSLIPEDARALSDAFGGPEFYISVEAIKEAIENDGQFNLIHAASGNKVDFMVAGHNLRDRTQFARRRTIELEPGLEISVAAPEDIIISKMQYYDEGGSEKHLRDITGILAVSPDEVDRDYIAEWAEILNLTEIWQAILRRAGK